MAEQNGAKPASEVLPSGAPDQVVEGIDVAHPAVDNDPRADTTADQNRIDFNDPGPSFGADRAPAEIVPVKAAPASKPKKI